MEVAGCLSSMHVFSTEQVSTDRSNDSTDADTTSNDTQSNTYSGLDDCLTTSVYSIRMTIPVGHRHKRRKSDM